ncbi:hypothetical protein IWT140_01837 [Secundilactobacillus pentosiphilus]|uniref:Uncharacterized protein n=1 Tax=Secundilactobacillus pentosiphilus TaxID=1714682 RepID=A0A1Z5IR33_9LACO|nr:hypothetical protein [Secundilactobacillus pentosiphilus]GAX04199.1 hypothetical protein IWT140_01837 [Secundilactobacillus pentosiphilus]
MRKKLRNMNQVKKYRLYKAKYQWVIATMAFVSLGLGAFTTSAQAEDTESTDSTIGGTTAQGQTLQSKTTTLRTSASDTHAVASLASTGTQQERATASSASGKQTQTQLSATKPQQIQGKSALQNSATSAQTKPTSVGNTTRTAVKDTATASSRKISSVADPNKVGQASADVKNPASIDATNIKYNTTTNTAMVNGSISATELQRLKTALSSVTDSTGVAATINQVADVPDVNAYKVQINGKDSDTLNVDQLKSTDVQQITVSGNFNPNDSLILDVPMGYGITKITGDNSSNFTGGSTVGTNDYYYTYTAKNKVQGNLNFYFSMDIPSYVSGNGDKLNISKLVDGNQTDSLPISVSLNGIRLKQPTITLNKTAIIKGLHYTNENNLNNTGLYNTQGGQLVKPSVDHFHSVIPSTDNRYYPTFNASDTLSADYQYTINFDGNTTLTALPTVHDGVTYLINNADAANYKLGQDSVNTIEVTVKKGTYDLNNYLFTNGLSEGLSAAGINKLKVATDGTINVKKTVTPSNSLEVNGTAVAINPDNATQVVSTPFNVAKYNYSETTNGYEFLPTAEQINQAPNGALVDQAYLVNVNSLDLPADGLDYIFEASNKGEVASRILCK